MHWGREVVRVDACLDAGHVYDYLAENCDAAATHLPVLPYRERHPYILLGGVALLVLGLSAGRATLREVRG